MSLFTEEVYTHRPLSRLYSYIYKQIRLSFFLKLSFQTYICLFVPRKCCAEKPLSPPLSKKNANSYINLWISLISWTCISFYRGNVTLKNDSEHLLLGLKHLPSLIAMCTHAHTRARTQTLAHTPKHRHTHAHTHIHTHTHTHTNINTQTHTHAYAHAHAQTHTFTRMHACIHTFTRTHNFLSGLDVWVIQRVLQQTATHCSTLQHTATPCKPLWHTATHCKMVQHGATHCYTLQNIAAYCSTVQHSATH